MYRLIPFSYLSQIRIAQTDFGLRADQRAFRSGVVLSGKVFNMVCSERLSAAAAGNLSPAAAAFSKAAVIGHALRRRMAMYGLAGSATRKRPLHIPRSSIVILQVSMTYTR